MTSGSEAVQTPNLSPMSQAMAKGSPVPRREMKQLMRRSDRPGLIRLFWWFVVLLSTGSLIWFAGDNPWLWLPATFLHGIVVVHHFALQHECSHYTPFKSRWLCEVLAHYCGFLLIIPPRFFRYEHYDHHTYTNLHGKDPELIELPISLRRYLLYVSSIPYWQSQIEGLIRRAFGKLRDDEKRFLPETERPKIVLESRLMLTGYALIALIMLTTGWTGPIWYWLVPMFMAEPVMRFIRMTEHVGRPNVEDMRINTRTNLVAAPWRFLAWNMNFHAEHHFAAAVPFHALPRLHDKLAPHIYVERQGYLHAHLDILRQVFARRAGGQLR